MRELIFWSSAACSVDALEFLLALPVADLGLAVHLPDLSQLIGCETTGQEHDEIV